ncbi:NAD(P)-binding protein [Roridomyces roridus]|uniref:NAD(P)-binding protein n=1 Tax=Roridomyces roridus TaxID=1738132 RepID=A0AAD7B7R2_9AGAR|nr:NAD(P)-binding protein [Roridomyces roridus]
MSSTKKLILVIGATGAQGLAVIDALLQQPSPYTVRALTRDPESPQARSLAERGVECVQGSFTDFALVAKALEGSYGVWVNTDGPTVGEAQEIYAGMRIFEIAQRTEGLKHYVWSSLPYILKLANFNPEYKVDHADAKGKVAEWISLQPSSDEKGNGLTWTIITSAPYMEMLTGGAFLPLNIRQDGTVVFATPSADGRVPLIALKDFGWWARWTFDHPAEASGRNIQIVSDRVTWDELVEVCCLPIRPAVFRRLTIDEMWEHADDRVNNPWSVPMARGDGTNTIRENMSGFWRTMRDDVFQTDLEWVRSVHPETMTVERWMRETGYEPGASVRTVLKNQMDGKNAWGYDPKWLAQL